MPTPVPASRRAGTLLTVLACVLLVVTVSARQGGAVMGTALPTVLAMGGQQAQSADHFEARIRPILANNCYDCHTDLASAGLRLDSLAALLQGGESGPVIVPGDPDSSLLLKVVRYTAGYPRMPLGGSKLSDADIDALAEWIRAGAVWPESEDAPVAPPPVASHEKEITPEHRAYWAFQPIAQTSVPAVTNTAWARTDIDRFILARLEAEGLVPVAPADKVSLLRRATLDLTGLPPTVEELEAFLADESPDAFAAVVDRLLASSRYGEAWGRMWLDVARYGEDDYRSLDPMGRGYNPYPNAYLYRDWVIRALNDDMPYDEFVTAQLAADLADPSRRLRNLPALGFLGLGPWYYDNAAVAIIRADERNDRVDAVSRGFLGLTVACARCHDHKYDPILTKDYYAMAGVFLNAEYHEYPLAPSAVVAAHEAEEEEIKKKQDLLNEFLGDESRQLGETLAFQASKYMQAVWRVVGEPKADKLRVIDGEKLDYELFERWLRFLQKPPAFYPYLTDWQAMVARGGTRADAARLADAFQERLVDVIIEQRAVEAENEIIEAKALPTTKPRKRANLPNEFKTNDDFCPSCGLELKSLPIERQNLFSDVFRSDLVADKGPGDPSFPPLLAFRGWGLERQLGGDRRAMIESLRADIKAQRDAMPPKFAYVHGVREFEDPANLRVHLRGNPNQLGDEVARGYVTVLGDGPERPTFTEGGGRLELARTIVDEPLAMRVIVNRVWKGHFGTGLVDTPSNFGVNGDKPSHPELIDFLAQSFIDSGLSIKALHRTIMLTATYQLGSEHDESGFAKDPDNRLHWRQSPRRMTAEQIRDSILFVSGTLDEKMGGPSQPLRPLFDRRTVYGRVSRYRLDEFLQLFDFPSASQSAEKRFVTNVPLQRLFLMNSDFMQQHAERLAARVAGEPTEEARIQRVYHLIFGREATDAEVQVGLDFLTNEPMLQYEEARAKEAEATAGKAEVEPMPPGRAAEPGDPDTGDPEDAVPPADGMMAGVTPGAGSAGDREKYLPVTPFGRYVKLLLSSNEFLFVN